MTSAVSLLEVRGLTVQYPQARRRPPFAALRDVSLSIDSGETVALVGESGSGKSTLGNAVLGLVPAAAGQVIFSGEDITHATPRRRRALTRSIQAVFQDPYGSLNPVCSIGRTLAEPLLAHGLAGKDSVESRVAAALERVGLSASAARKYPAQFSGGQRQRIAIARALMLSPQLIICDEALSALDLSVQAQILNLLRQLQHDLGVSYLFISHDLAVVRHIARRVVVLYHGRVMEAGPAGQVCEHPSHPYTQALVMAGPLPDPAQQRAKQRSHAAGPAASAAVPVAGCVFAPRCPYALEACGRDEPAPVRAVHGGSVSCSRYPDLASARQPRPAAGREPSPGAEPEVSGLPPPRALPTYLA